MNLRQITLSKRTRRAIRVHIFPARESTTLLKSLDNDFAILLIHFNSNRPSVRHFAGYQG